MSRQSPKVIRSQFLSVCKMTDSFKPGPFLMIVFGGAGDLSRRKLLPALYHLYRDEQITNFIILGVGRTERSDEEYRVEMGEYVSKYSGDLFEKVKWDAFASHLRYISGDVSDAKLYVELRTQTDSLMKKVGIDNLLYYLSVPIGVVSVIIDHMAQQKIWLTQKQSKVIIEKPFGKDRDSAKALNTKVLEVFEESQIYRIDHYLGKETVQNILFFRFANSIFEPIWKRNYIDHIEISVTETEGVGTRGDFYEESGIIRDVVQNHLLQLVSLVAMEPPVGFEANLIRDEKLKVYRSIRQFTPEEIAQNTVIGQYGAGTVAEKIAVAYRKESKVNTKSVTPTFFAGRFFVDNWRLAGVPIYVRTGKRLKKRVTELVVYFKHPPLKLLGCGHEEMPPNAVVMSITPHESINICFSVKLPGMVDRAYPVKMSFDYQETFGRDYSPYERLLIDCMKGDQTLFPGAEEIECMWSIVDPIIRYWEEKGDKHLPIYEAGTWGPESADRLMQEDGNEWRCYDE